MDSKLICFIYLNKKLYQILTKQKCKKKKYEFIKNCENNIGRVILVFFIFIETREHIQFIVITIQNE